MLSICTFNWILSNSVWNSNKISLNFIKINIPMTGCTGYVPMSGHLHKIYYC